MKKLLKLLFHRVVLVGVAIAAQVLVLTLVFVYFQDRFVYFYGICILISFAVVLRIVNGKSNPGYKIAWIITVMAIPVFGGLFYLMFGGNKLSPRVQRKMFEMEDELRQNLENVPSALDKVNQYSYNAGNQARYIQRYAFCPVYENTSTQYLPSGEAKFERLKQELEKAEHYIFMEYFIIEEGIMWNSILEILRRKVKEGVEVRILYDDLGCVKTLPYQYYKTLEQMGIQCMAFNPFIPVLSSRLNNRDHRKIVVIDGYIGFTGGINLADEYINAYEKHGHWKDAAIVLTGDAVWSFTVMFLTLWDYVKGTKEDYSKYKPAVHHSTTVKSDGFVQPFTDNPWDNEPVGETVYFNMINKAKRYVYINTPYLIVDNEIVTALISAAKAGVDVRIVTPHIADKWFVHAVTRSYYRGLIEGGVKIYEYTPGFIHAKTFAVDDEYGVVGSINMDYRSLYLHFECGVWLYRTASVVQVKNDFLKTLNICQEITLEDCKKVKWYIRLGRAILKVFAPLM